MDNSDFYKMIEVMSQKNTTYVEGVSEIINMCKTNNQHKDWTDLEKINHLKILKDFDSTFIKLMKYLKSNKINGLYFGFTEIALGKSLKNFSYMVEVGGTENCNFDDKKCEWSYSCNWYPKNIAFQSGELTKMRVIINNPNGLGNAAEYPIGLAFTVLTINELIRKYEKKLGGRKIAVIAGFHDGDMIKIKGFNEM